MEISARALAISGLTILLSIGAARAQVYTGFGDSKESNQPSTAGVGTSPGLPTSAPPVVTEPPAANEETAKRTRKKRAAHNDRQRVKQKAM